MQFCSGKASVYLCVCVCVSVCACACVLFVVIVDLFTIEQWVILLYQLFCSFP